jgi:hypothetical protein
LEYTDKLIEAGFEDSLKRALSALKDDMIKNPKNYQFSLRIQVSKLFGIPEIG